jgi:Transposase DDE domain
MKMDWQLFLIELYSEVQELYYQELVYHCQKFSNNTDKLEVAFTDVELISVYLFGLIKERHKIKQIHGYIEEHWLSWFPNLPSYKNFVVRLNNLHAVFPVLLNRLSNRFTLPQWVLNSLTNGKLEAITDTMPIIMAQGNRSYTAKVALDIADRGYCSTKKLKYHGVKLSALNLLIPKQLPKPRNLIVTPASHSDITIFKELIAPTLQDMTVFADKIYNDGTLEKDLKTYQNVDLLPIQKRYRGQIILNADDELFNTLKSQCRQPIESFFNWINERTGIQAASKVRSSKGLYAHVWGRLAAVFFIFLLLNP